MGASVCLEPHEALWKCSPASGTGFFLLRDSSQVVRPQEEGLAGWELGPQSLVLLLQSLLPWEEAGCPGAYIPSLPYQGVWGVLGAGVRASGGLLP